MERSAASCTGADDTVVTGQASSMLGDLLVLLRRPGGAARAIHVSVIKELGATGLPLSGDRQEAQLRPRRHTYPASHPCDRVLFSWRLQQPYARVAGTGAGRTVERGTSVPG